MTQNIQINNVCPPIKVWYQYDRIPAIKNYFIWLQSYWQGKFFDFTYNTAAQEMSIFNSLTDYLFYYALYLLGITKVPWVLIGTTVYDQGFKHDDPTVYYDPMPTAVATQPQFKTYLTWLFDWSEDNWTMPALIQLIRGFTGVAFSDILIEQDDPDLDIINITLPNNDQTLLFQSFLNFYAEAMNLPFGVTFTLILV